MFAFMTVDDLSRRWRKSPTTLRRWIREGRLRAVKLGDSEWRVPPQEVERLEGQDRPAA